MSEIKVNKISPRSGTTVTLGDSGDTFTIPSGATITNAGTANGFGATGAVNWQTTKKTANFTATSGEGYFCDTAASGAFTLTLPSSPSAGDIVGLKDYNGNFATANLTIGRGGSNLDGSGADKVLNTNHLSLTLVYVDATKGWIPIEEGTGFVGESFVCASVSGSCNTIVTCGDYKVAVFKGPGNFTVNGLATNAPDNNVDYVVAAGGGAGGTGDPGGYTGGAGGAGGFRESPGTATCYTASPLGASPAAAITLTVQAYPISVGGGGAVNPSPTFGGSGSVSSFSTISSAGGGGGGGGNSPCNVANAPGRPGGSGGGGGSSGNATYPGGTGNTPPVTPAQGQNGGTGGHSGGGTASGAGGGAGAVGGNGTPGPAPSPASLGAGGTGVGTLILNCSSFGTPGPSPARFFAGGGGGASNNCLTNASAVGGGGKGTTNTSTGTAGTANTGGGGGGGVVSPTPVPRVGLAGGSGIVMIRYKYQ
jgi:hypothetical protein